MSGAAGVRQFTAPRNCATRQGADRRRTLRAQRPLDRGFGSRGIFRTALPAKKGPFIATSIMEERSTRRLVVVGGYGQGSMLVLRLTADGRLDRTFGKHRSGLTRVTAGGIAESVALQRGGRILVRVTALTVTRRGRSISSSPPGAPLRFAPHRSGRCRGARSVRRPVPAAVRPVTYGAAGGCEGPASANAAALTEPSPAASS